MQNKSVLLFSLLSVAAVMLWVGWLSVGSDRELAHPLARAVTDSNAIDSRSSPGPDSEVAGFPLIGEQRAMPEPGVEEVFLATAVKGQIADISKAYAENIRYPSYSKPLRKSDWNLLNPRPFVAKDVPLAINPNSSQDVDLVDDPDGQSDISAAIVLDHYVVHQGRDLPVSVRISSESGATALAI